MAEETQDPSAWVRSLKVVKEIVQQLVIIAAAVGSIAAYRASSSNGSKIENNGAKLEAVQSNLLEQDAASKDVKLALDKTHADTNAKLATIEKKVEKVNKP